MTTLVNEFRRLYDDLGYTTVIPCIPAEKRPGTLGRDGSWYGLRDWPSRIVSSRDLDDWHRTGASRGIRTGPQPDGTRLIAVDADTLSPKHADTGQGVVRKHLGQCPTRIGRAPKALYLVRLDGPFPYKSLVFDDGTEKGGEIEFLSRGQQFIASGIHPDTGAGYDWPTPLVPFSDLPIISVADFETFVDELSVALDASPYQARSEALVISQAELEGDSVVIAEAMAGVPNTMAAFPRRRDLLKVCYALKASKADFEVFDRFYEGYEGGDYEPELSREMWESLRPPYQVGADFIYRLALKHNPTFTPADRYRDEKWAAREGVRASAHFDPAHLSPGLVWFGDTPPQPPPMLVDGLLPQGQTAIIAGVYGVGKTFVADDLAACVMLGVPFAGREVVRPGAVLWLAAEGLSEADVRIEAAVAARSLESPPPAVPFARQTFEVPKLTAPSAKAELLALVDQFKAGLAHRFPGVEIVMIVVDTLGSAAEFVDGNSPAEAQRVMQLLRAVNTATGALMVVVDHFGKLVETGVMGASSKAQSAEVVLALLSNRDIEGRHSDRRMAVHKFRMGQSGAVTPFNLREVPAGDAGRTTAVVDWGVTDLSGFKPPPAPKAKAKWTGVARTLKGCIDRALAREGTEQRPHENEPPVRAVPVEVVRAEFRSTYPGTPDAKRKAFGRTLSDVCGRELVETRTMGPGDVDFLWLKPEQTDAVFPDTGPDRPDAPL